MYAGITKVVIGCAAIYAPSDFDFVFKTVWLRCTPYFNAAPDIILN